MSFFLLSMFKHYELLIKTKGVTVLRSRMRNETMDRVLRGFGCCSSKLTAMCSMKPLCSYKLELTLMSF